MPLSDRKHQLARILEIDRRIRARQYPKPEALATEFGVQRRMIFKDRDFLVREMGAPLKYSRRHGGWYYDPEQWALPSLTVNRGEMLALLLGVEAARHQLGPVLQHELMSAIDKIGQSLEAGNVTIDLETLRQDITFADPLAPNVATKTVLALYEAIQHRQVLDVTYHTASRDEISRRELEPYHLYNVLGDWYVIAREPAANRIKTFHASRIQRLEATMRHFTRDLNFDARSFIEHGFRAESGPDAFDVRIRFTAAQAPYLKERQLHPTQQLESLPDGAVLLTMRASGLGELTRWTLQYGGRAEVLSPPELREAVIQAVRDMGEIYGGEF